MDADAVLNDFTSTAYVIERPADSDVLADAATRMLQKAGLRLRFGSEARACAQAEKAVGLRLPSGMEIMPRGGRHTPKAAVIVSGPAAAKDATATMLETWNAAGLAAHGYDCGKATSYAVKASLNSGADEEKVRSHPLANEALAADARFEARPWGSMPQGPSWLPPDRFNAKSLKTVAGVHPDLLTVVKRASEICSVRFEVVPTTGGVRSEGEQARIKAAGRSRARIGRHTIGHAIDLVPVDRRGRIDFSDLDGFDAIREAMEKAAEELNIPIQWGGNWRKLVDRPHFELDRLVYPAPGEEADPEALQVAFR